MSHRQAPDEDLGDVKRASEGRGWEERTYSLAQGCGFSQDHVPPQTRATLDYILLPPVGQIQLKKEALKWL